MISRIKSINASMMIHLLLMTLPRTETYDLVLKSNDKWAVIRATDEVVQIK